MTAEPLESLTISAPAANARGSFTVDLDASSRLITLAGELDAATAPLLLDAADLLAVDHPEPVVVDLSAVRFVDSSGLGAIVRLRKRLLAGGGDLVVTGATGAPLRTFQLGGLGSLLA
jgi:anti-sigma B factor antagonist